jgi:hypothetical protein
MKDIREDLVDGYRYVQTTLNKDLQEAGSSVIVDPSRCSYLGWSAGGTNVLYMVRAWLHSHGGYYLCRRIRAGR